MNQFTIYIPLPKNPANNRLYDDLARALMRNGFQLGASMTITDQLGDEHFVRAATIPVDRVEQLHNSGWVK